MRLEAKKYLYDIQRAIGLLREFVADKTFPDYVQDAMLRSAVERQFEIIGEAISQLARVDDSTFLGISNSKRIVAFRNVLIHEYGEIDDRLVWDVLETSLHTLELDVGRLLAEG